MALLAAGLMCVILLQQRLNILGHLTWLDRIFIAIILAVTAGQLLDIAGVLAGDHAQLTTIQV